MHPLLSAVAHREDPPPSRPWVMTQGWRDLLFAHWAVAPASLRPHVPAALDLDLFDGSAWLGVVPFRMENVRLRGLPAPGPFSAFHELNVRTYVRRRGRPCVYFFSLDAASRLAVATARAWFGLPYFFARMASLSRPLSGRSAEDAGVEYASRRIDRKGPPAELRMRYRPTGPVFSSRAGTLDHFLTERYRLVVERRGRIVIGEIHHPPWPLRPAEAEWDVNTMGSQIGLALDAPPDHLLFARTLDTLEWAPRVDD